jgi:hypothetical protein
MEVVGICKSDELLPVVELLSVDEIGGGGGGPSSMANEKALSLWVEEVFELLLACCINKDAQSTPELPVDETFMASSFRWVRKPRHAWAGCARGMRRTGGPRPGYLPAVDVAS